MSNFLRSVKRSLRDLKGESRWYHTPIDSFWFWWDHSYINSAYYKCRAFVCNLKLFLQLAWTWRPWDFSYTIAVLVKLLDKHAKSLKNGYHVNSEKTYRRCMTAAGKLDRAYNKDIDKVISYLLVKYPPRMLKNEKGYTVMTFTPEEIDKKRIHDGMWDIAHRREKENDKKEKKEAWEYLNKYIEHFWD